MILLLWLLKSVLETVIKLVVEKIFEICVKQVVMAIKHARDKRS